MSAINMDIEYPKAMKRIAELDAENRSMADDICSLTTAHECAEQAEAKLACAVRDSEFWRDIATGCKNFTGYSMYSEIRDELAALRAQQCAGCEELGHCKVHHEAAYYGWDKDHDFACGRWAARATP